MRADGAVVVGSYAAGNLGDVALLLKTIEVLRSAYAADAITVYAPEQAYLRAQLPGVRFLEPHWARVLRGDLLVYGGGTQFCSFPAASPRAPSRATKALRSPGMAFRHVVRTVAARAWSFRRRAALGIGIGPFVAGSPNEQRTRALFERMDFVAVRDPASLAHCEAWGVRHAALRTDLCFVGGRLSDLRAQERVARAPRSVAAIVREWGYPPGGRDYLPPLLETARRARREGRTFRFLSFCAHDDREVIARLRREGQEVIAWSPTETTLEAFVGQLADYDSVVTARYHGAIFCALLGIPCVCVEIEPKLRLVAGALGVEGYRWTQPFSPEALEEAIARLAAERSRASERVAESVLRERALGDRMAEEFAAFARSGAPGPR